MFAEVIRFVVRAALPPKDKLLLCLAALQPVEAHVHRLRFPRHHCAADQSVRRRVVRRDGRRRLTVAEFFE